MGSQRHREKLTVEFTGTRSGTWPATFVQANTLDWTAREPGPSVLSEVVELTPGVLFEDLAETASALLTRYETLRTVFPPTPRGKPVQTVLDSGILVIPIRNVSRSQLSERHVIMAGAREPFDLATEVPIRVIVFAENEHPVCVRLDMSHVAVDEAAARRVKDDFRELVHSQAARTGLASPEWQPVDQARSEHSERGRRRMAETLRYWSEQLNHSPLCCLPLPTHHEAFGFMSATLRSEAAAQGVEAVRLRTQTHPSYAVVTAVTAVLNRWTGNPLAAVYTTCSNRYLPQLADYMGTVAQETLIPVEAMSASFDAMVRTVQARALSAYRYGHYDAAELTRLIDQISRERGTHRHRDVIVNDLSGFDAATEPPAPALAGTAKALQQGVVEVREGALHEDPFRLTIRRLAPAVELTVTWDTRLISPHAMRRLLRGAECLLIAAGQDDIDPGSVGRVTGLRPVERGPGWVRVDSHWVDLPQVRRIVEDALRPRPARLFAVPAEPAEPSEPSDPDGKHVIVACTVAVRGQRNDIDWLHERCMAGLGQRHGVMAPQRYLLFEHAPRDLDDWEAWQEREPLAAGTARHKGQRWSS